MTRKCVLRVVSVALVILITCLSFALSVSADNAISETAIGSKIDASLQEKLNTMDDDETVSISVWFSDIDKAELANAVESRVNTNAARGIVSAEARSCINYESGIVNIENAELTAADTQFLIESESFDIESNFQLLEFIPPSDDLGFYTVAISRHGPTGFTTPVSLSVFDCETMY